ncbi:uncharacterized protein AB675_1018 [Cyphellophora attinorum]|uniref:Heterokaryon incompatibility domain-containing protein n=1 Tax=Cyphellophora attinorum TaxID=1664694 RepID=A0A0N1NZS3_9EURO|nr:uncharacterized protein AB675_1018 [Phialophora attinorum]KPI38073.1 hypothetical protein AB675_1018 [Phialophora attinorum]
MAGVIDRRPYDYARLNGNTHEIRLIHLFRTLSVDGFIQCRLETLELSKATNLRALSYAWGPEQPKRQIIVDGKLLTVRENLYDFLQAYSRKSKLAKRRNLWIDAICINQSDIEERNH